MNITGVATAARQTSVGATEYDSHFDFGVARPIATRRASKRRCCGTSWVTRRVSIKKERPAS